MLCTGRFSPGGKTTLMVWRGQLHADSGQTAAAATWRDPSRAVTETLSCVPAPCAASDTPSTVAMPGMVIRAFKENVARVHEVDDSWSFE